MADIISTAQGMFSGINMGGIGNMLLWIVVLILVIGVAGFIIYLIIQKKRYKYKLVIFEKVNGKFEPNRKDMGMALAVGKAGDQVLFLKRAKKTIPFPSIQTGRNTFWFWIREDGEWINMGPGDYDQDARELGARFLDKEARYARTSLETSFRERYDKPKFWEKYGGLIINIVLIAIILIFLGWHTMKQIELQGAVNQGVKQVEPVLTALNDILVKMQQIKASSGYVAGG